MKVNFTKYFCWFLFLLLFQWIWWSNLHLKDRGISWSGAHPTPCLLSARCSSQAGWIAKWFRSPWSSYFWRLNTAGGQTHLRVQGAGGQDILLYVIQRFWVRHRLSCGRNLWFLRDKRVMHTLRCKLCKKLVRVWDQVTKAEEELFNTNLKCKRERIAKHAKIARLSILDWSLQSKLFSHSPISLNEARPFFGRIRGSSRNLDRHWLKNAVYMSAGTKNNQVFPNLRYTVIYLLRWAWHACLLQGSLCLLPCCSFSAICHLPKLALAGRQSRMALAKRRCAPPQFYSEIYGIVFSIIVTSVTAMMTILQQLTLFSSALVIGFAICCNV